MFPKRRLLRLFGYIVFVICGFTLASMLAIFFVNTDPFDVQYKEDLRNPQRSNYVENPDYEYRDGMVDLGKYITKVVSRINHILQTPSRSCKKLIDLGGKILCNGKNKQPKNKIDNGSIVGNISDPSQILRNTIDGNKAICMEEGVAPKSGSCLALSIGIGNDFSFDDAIARYGCRVVSLDFTMENWTHSFRGPGKHFISAGISNKNHGGIASDDEKGKKIFYSMLTLNSLVRIIDAENSAIDYLKMDIENAEWEVLEQVLSKTPWVLRRVKQLALEVHLEDVQELPRNPDVALDKVERILNVLNGLKRLGFHVVKWWRNDWSNIEIKVEDQIVYVYLEVLMVKSW